MNREQAIDHRANKFLEVPFIRQELEQVLSPLFEENPRLLLVDDSKTSRKLVRPALEQEGYTVLEADNSEVALKIIRQQEKLTVPVLLLSSQQTDQAIISGFNVGADDYIIKSDHSTTRNVVLPELLSRVERLMHASSSLGRPERILVVEDSATMLHQMKTSLQIQGFQVDGLELCTRIRQFSEFSQLPIIIETSKDSIC